MMSSAIGLLQKLDTPIVLLYECESEDSKNDRDSEHIFFMFIQYKQYLQNLNVLQL